MILSTTLCKLALVNFFVEAHRASAICSCWKIYKCLLHQTAREIILLLVNHVHEKILQKVETEKILKACMHFL